MEKIRRNAFFAALRQKQLTFMALKRSLLSFLTIYIRDVLASLYIYTHAHDIYSIYMYPHLEQEMEWKEKIRRVKNFARKMLRSTFVSMKLLLEKNNSDYLSKILISSQVTG